MAQISVEIKGLDELIKKVEQFPKIAENHINKAINMSLLRIEREAKIQSPFGISGGLRDRWNRNFGRLSGTLSSGVGYASGVEEGTLPHKVSVSAIAPWAIKHGLNPGAVAESIEKKGTKANPFFSRAIEMQKEEIDKEFSLALDGIMEDITK